MNIVGNQRFDSILPEINGKLPSMIGRMVNDMKENILNGIGVLLIFRVRIIHTTLKIFDRTRNFKRAALILVVYIAPILNIV